MTRAAKRQGDLKFRREHLLHLSVCIAPTCEERDELLRGVTPVHVEGVKALVRAADVTGQNLQLSLVIVPGGAVVMEKSLDTGHDWEGAK